MRALLQRVLEASCTVEGKLFSEIRNGLLVFLGVGALDDESDARMLIEKIQTLRIFEDAQEKMNLSVIDAKGEIMIVSQFTLYADCKKGRRPSFTDAAVPAKANQLYNFFVSEFRKSSIATNAVKTGVFQAMMDISLVNSGPVTIMLDSRELRHAS